MDLLYQLSVEPLKNTLIGYDGRSFGFFVCRNASVMLFEVATVKYYILSPPPPLAKENGLCLNVRIFVITNVTVYLSV